MYMYTGVSKKFISQLAHLNPERFLVSCVIDIHRKKKMQSPS